MRHTSWALVTGVQTCALSIFFDEARVVGECGDVVLGEIPQHRVHAFLKLVQAGAEMDACGLTGTFEDLVTMLQGNVNVALNELRQMKIGRASGRERV